MGKSKDIVLVDENNFNEQLATITAQDSFDKVKHVISDIKRTLYANPEVVALCAPQIDEQLRLFVVRNGKQDSNRFKVLLNPLIVNHEGLHLSREVNPSIPNKQFIIPRYNKMHVAYQTFDGHVTSETFVGFYSEVVQQMIEMLDGITLADYGLDLDDLGGAEAFDNATKEEKTQVLAAYMEHLKNKLGLLQEEINSNESMKYINDLIDFNTEVLKGNIKPLDENGEVVDEEYIKKHAAEIAKKKVDAMLNKDGGVGK